MLLNNVNLPNLNREGMTADRKIAAVLEYAHSLKQQLDYVLSNLDESNLGSALTGSLSATDAAVKKLSEADFGQQLALKLNTKDVKNDLEATGAGKALDAYQGRVLKTMIEERVKVSELTDRIYPVGSVYMSVNATSPATLFGGTWAQLSGRFLLGASSTYPAGGTGGEATHTLTVNEMPAHTHKPTTDAAPNTTEYTNYVFQTIRQLGSASTARYKIAESSSGTLYVNAAKTTASDFGSVDDVSAVSTTASTGGGAAHNNMPPYLAVYMWKRMA